MKKLKVVVSFSGGKDSMLCLYRVLKKNYEVIGLVSTFADDNDTCFHRIPKSILESVSESLNIPLIKVKCSNGTVYEKEFEKALIHAKEQGAKYCIFGDIDIEQHKKWGVDRCNNVGIKSMFPLWQENREKIVNEFLDYGFKAIIKKVNLNALGMEFLGEILSKDIIIKIKEQGADPCGENGEYHTLVYDGPIFSKKIEFNVLGKEEVQGYGYLNVLN
ncbi:MAG: diphthine--ammonia ligase [Clostridium butyricum]|nr:diphthine--ammonia ligase [Clostridium butyricum]